MQWSIEVGTFLTDAIKTSGWVDGWSKSRFKGCLIHQSKSTFKYGQKAYQRGFCCHCKNKNVIEAMLKDWDKYILKSAYHKHLKHKQTQVNLMELTGKGVASEVPKYFFD